MPGPRERATASAAVDACANSHDSAAPRRMNPRRSAWAELLQRVVAFDVLACPRCGARRQFIALIDDGFVERKILHHLRLPTEPPDLAPARVTAKLAFDA